MAIDYQGGFDFSQLRAKLDDILPDALMDGGNVIGDLAVKRAPLLEGEALRKANQERRADPGELRESKFVRLSGNASVAIGFSAFYAPWVEEHMDWNHTSGQAKFLSSSLDDGGEDALDKISTRIDRDL